MNRNVDQLKAHSRQVEIYGEETIDSELIKSIKDNGVLQPVIINADGVILSGFRRWRAADKAGLKIIPVDERGGLSDIEQLAVLIEANRQRVKTARQMGREAIALQEIESERARLRQAATRNNNAGRAVVEKLPPQVKEEKGKTRDKIGKHLGMSGRTVEKLIEVEKKIEKLEETGHAEEAKKLEKKLNQKSINAAYSDLQPKAESKPRDPIVPKVSSVLPDELPGITQDWVRGKQWELYILVMRKLTGKSENEVRKILGRLAQDISQSAIMGAMAIAGNRMDSIRSEKLEPVAYVRAIASRINESMKGNGHGKGASPVPGKYAGRG